MMSMSQQSAVSSQQSAGQFLCTRWSLAAGYPLGGWLLAAALLLTAGCDEPTGTSGPLPGTAVVGDHRGQVFQTFASNLNHLEDFPPEQMLPLLRDHLNHWRRAAKPEIRWQPDPVVDTLPKALRDLPEVKRIDATDFDLRNMEFLIECIWLRDIARTARGEGFDDVAIASRLFDWTIRNLQIEPETADNGGVVNQSLSEILLLGRATALERAWVFIQLCRQQGLDAVMLAIPEGENKTKLRPWLPAVRVKDELYLFDPRLGLPIPGAKGKPVATLSEIAADDSLLRSLDLDAAHPYPLKSSDVQSVVALVEASPGYLSRGMKLVESRLAGDERVVLTSTPSKSIEALKKIKHVGDARLWLMPYEVLEARHKRTPEDQQMAFREMFMFLGNTPLYGGRVRQFKGDFDGERGAKWLYLESRPAQAQVDAIPLAPERKKVLTEVKQAASFWLGLIAFDQKDYPVAVDYFRERVLIASPDGPWTAGARYNLGRTYEAMGETEKAVAQYQLDKSPQSTGNKLRARRLLKTP
jgi:tetratricopeptide (TPR) repeat protein